METRLVVEDETSVRALAANPNRGTPQSEGTLSLRPPKESWEAPIPAGTTFAREAGLKVIRGRLRAPTAYDVDALGGRES